MNITVFLASREGVDPKYRRAIEALAEWIGGAGHTLVYGGSRLGLMGVLAETVKRRGGRVIGIEPRFFVEACLQLDSVDELIVTEGMADRKDRLIRMADVIVTFPGGVGTLEEFSQTLSMLDLGHAAARCVVYNVDHYYDPLRALLDEMANAGFCSPETRNRVMFASGLDEVIRAIETAPRLVGADGEA